MFKNLIRERTVYCVIEVDLKCIACDGVVGQGVMTIQPLLHFGSHL